jgi:hypothetical protein
MTATKRGDVVVVAVAGTMAGLDRQRLALEISDHGRGGWPQDGGAFSHVTVSLRFQQRQ